MGRLESAMKVFFAINQELDKIERNALVVNKLRTINEELADAVIELIKKYEQCKSTTTFVNSPKTSTESMSEKTDPEKQQQLEYVTP